MNDMFQMPHRDGADIFGIPPAGDLVAPDIQQRYDNTCAIRCQEIIMRDFGINIPEDTLRSEAEACHWYDPNGGTSIDDVGKLLVAHGIPASRYDHANVYQLVNELAAGKKIIVGVDSNELWKDDAMEDLKDVIFGGQPDHALIVAGIDTADPDNVQVVLTDPGTGHVAKAYPLDQFLDAWNDSDNFMVVTDNAAPNTAWGMENFDGYVDLDQFAYSQNCVNMTDEEFMEEFT